MLDSVRSSVCPSNALCGAHSAVKVPQVGQVLRLKCPRWGRFRGKRTPGGADFAEKVKAKRA